MGVQASAYFFVYSAETNAYTPWGAQSAEREGEGAHTKTSTYAPRPRSAPHSQGRHRKPSHCGTRLPRDAETEKKQTHDTKGAPT